MSPHAGRRDRVRACLHGSGIDGALVTGASDIHYLTGFTGSQAVLYLALDERLEVFATDGRYAEQSAVECPDLGALIARRPLAAAVEQAAAGGAGRIGIDASAAISAQAEIAARGLEPVIRDLGIGRARSVKDAAEIALLARACEMTSEALALTAGEIRVGMTEVTVARLVETHMGNLGATDRSFSTIVASGPHSALPHHAPGPRALEAGDLLIIDCGALLEGYHADMTRTFIVGEPTDWQVRLHAAVRDAAAASRAAVRSGVPTATVDAAARDVLALHGLSEAFVHGTGHGIGLDIHEAPMIGVATEGRLGADMTITVEPGAYLPGRGGIRIEDSLLVLDEGHRVLTEYSRELRPVG